MSSSARSRRYVALVALLGHRRVEAEPLPVAGGERLAEAGHLGAVVVDVELAGDVVADEGEDAAERVAVRRVARVADVQRTGRVDADELDVHLLAPVRRQRAPAVVAALGEEPVEGAAVPGVVQEQVEEAGPGDLEAVADAGAGAGHPARADGLGELARRAPGALGRDQRRVGRDVAVLGARRQRELHGRSGHLGGPAGRQFVLERGLQGGRESVQVVEVVAHGHRHPSSCARRAAGARRFYPPTRHGATRPRGSVRAPRGASGRQPAQ